MKGYKIFNVNLKNKLMCRHYIFNEGLNLIDNNDEIIMCKNGFHFCTDLNDCFKYYSLNFIKEYRIYQIEASGIITSAENGCSKRSCSEINLVKELNHIEIYELLSSNNKLMYCFLYHKTIDHHMLLNIDYSSINYILNDYFFLFSKFNINELIQELIPKLLECDKSIVGDLLYYLLCQNKNNKILFDLVKHKLIIKDVKFFRIFSHLIDDLDYIMFKDFKVTFDIISDNLDLKEILMQYVRTFKDLSLLVLDEIFSFEYAVEHVRNFKMDRYVHINHDYLIKTSNDILKGEKNSEICEILPYLNWDDIKLIYEYQLNDSIKKLIESGDIPKGENYEWWLLYNRSYFEYFKALMANGTLKCKPNLGSYFTSDSDIEFFLKVLTPDQYSYYLLNYPYPIKKMISHIKNNNIIIKGELVSHMMYNCKSVENRNEIIELFDNVECIELYQINSEIVDVKHVNKIYCLNDVVLYYYLKKYPIEQLDGFINLNSGSMDKILKFYNDESTINKMVKLYGHLLPISFIEYESHRNTVKKYITVPHEIFKWVDMWPDDKQYFIDRGLIQ